MLGRGGMGFVYEAEHLLLKRKAALKTLAPELGGDVDFKERFIRESQTVASIERFRETTSKSARPATKRAFRMCTGGTESPSAESRSSRTGNPYRGIGDCDLGARGTHRHYGP
jgi:hypothetical protein